MRSAIPSSDGRPLVADVSMGRVTYGDVLSGRASPRSSCRSAVSKAHKAFALAVGLQAFVDALAGDGAAELSWSWPGPEADPCRRCER